METSREDVEQWTTEYGGEGIEENDSESDSEYVGDEYVNIMDDFEFDKHVDLSVEYVGVGGKENEPEIEGEVVGKGGFSGSNLNDCPNLSDDASLNESDSDGSVSIWTNFRAITDMENPNFTLGMTFASKKEFKEAVLNYAFKNGKELKFVRNDKNRYIVECKHDACPWRINLRKDPKCESWRILGMRDIHDGCSWVYKNKMVKSSIVARRWTKEVQHHLDWKMLNFKDKVCTAERFDMSDRQAWRAMAQAKKKIQGDEEENFKKLWRYVAEINRTNPMSTCCVKLSDLTDMSGHSRFLRLYMCWEACKKGFQFCRPIIGVDGCHLKSATRGQMLIAIGIDANDSIFPLAYAIVEGETKQSWCWFLQLLKRDLLIGEHNEEEFTFISDKQKGLLPAFEDTLPRSEHRFCVRHLHGNMKVAGFQGKALKDAMWRCARSFTVSTFTTAMRELRDLDVRAWEWLNDKHPREWSRSHFSCTPQSDMLVNNICECFNSIILAAREKPIIACLEGMRHLLMTRFFDSYQKAKEWSYEICPRVLEKVQVNEKQAASYRGFQCGLHEFEIQGFYGDQQSVNLEVRSCTCRRWDLTGLPCKHAICAIWIKHGKGPVYAYVNPCYTKARYLQIYEGSIHPMAGVSEWPVVDRPPPLPPVYNAKPGRPKKLRTE